MQKSAARGNFTEISTKLITLLSVPIFFLKNDDFTAILGRKTTCFNPTAFLLRPGNIPWLRRPRGEQSRPGHIPAGDRKETHSPYISAPTRRTRGGGGGGGRGVGNPLLYGPWQARRRTVPVRAAPRRSHLKRFRQPLQRLPQWRNRLAHGTYTAVSVSNAGVVSSSLTWGTYFISSFFLRCRWLVEVARMW